MTKLVHVFFADGTYHDCYAHGNTGNALHHEFHGNIPEIYSFSDYTGLWSHYHPSKTKPNQIRWSRILYEEVPPEIKAQMVILGLHCATDGESLNPFKPRHK